MTEIYKGIICGTLAVLGFAAFKTLQDSLVKPWPIEEELKSTKAIPKTTIRNYPFVKQIHSDGRRYADEWSDDPQVGPFASPDTADPWANTAFARLRKCVRDHNNGKLENLSPAHIHCMELYRTKGIEGFYTPGEPWIIRSMREGARSNSLPPV